MKSFFNFINSLPILIGYVIYAFFIFLSVHYNVVISRISLQALASSMPNMPNTTVLTVISAVISSVVAILILVGAVHLIATRMFNGSDSFAHFLSLCSWAFLFQIIGTAIAIVLISNVSISVKDISKLALVLSNTPELVTASRIMMCFSVLSYATIAVITYFSQKLNVRQSIISVAIPAVLLSIPSIISSLLA